jgi:ubiquinone/menaquinone biosynthesis C-methylase UbiE
MSAEHLLRGLLRSGPWGADAARFPLIARTLAKQLRRPSGLCGKLVARLISRVNRQANEWTLGLLEIHPTDKVLEVGFGPGLAIEKAATIATHGWVIGVDFSETMVQLTRRRNAPAIAAGRVALLYGTLPALPYRADAFDRIFAVNVIYYLPEPMASFQELWRVMKPGGRMALFLYAKEAMAKRRFARAGGLLLYTAEEVVQLLTQARFRRVWFEAKRMKRMGLGICALAQK